jgi:hypothetical protein
MRRLAFAFAAVITLAAPALAAGPLDELRRSFTLAGKPVPPEVFRDFGDADLGDSLPAVVAIDVKAAIDSNRYGDPIARRGGWLTQSRAAPTTLNGAEEISYRYIGVTKSGLLVVIATYSGGGSGVFTTLHVLDASLARRVRRRRQALRPGRPRCAAQRRFGRPLARRSDRRRRRHPDCDGDDAGERSFKVD